MRGESFTPDPENGYKRERERERDALARNPREKWAQNLGIRPASQTARGGEYRIEPTERASERPAIPELASRLSRHAGGN